MKANTVRRRKTFGLPTILRGLTREILVGVVIGVIVLGLTPLVNSLTTSANTRKKQYSDLSSVRVGMSRGYLDDLFGFPVIETIPFLYDEYETLELTSAGYKLKDCVLLCMFDHNSLVAYVVVVNGKGLYRLPYMTLQENRKLLEFSYTDILNNQRLLKAIEEKTDVLPIFITMQGNVPGNNNDYAYYYELYYGGGPADYNYFLYGDYKDFHLNKRSDELMWLAQDYHDSVGEMSEEDLSNYLTMREQVRPNVFGVICNGYAGKFDFVFDIIQTRDNGALLFDDWFTE